MIFNVEMKKKWTKQRFQWLLNLPFDNFHSSFDEKTPVAKIVSLQTTPLYGLWFPPLAEKRMGKIIYLDNR